MNETPKELVILKGLLSKQTIGVVQVPKQNSNTLTKEVLHELFEYRDNTLYNKISRRKARAGDQAGAIRDDGYRQVCIFSKVYLLHRIIFMYHNGYLPSLTDHIDGNKQNNAIENLREATKSQNAYNIGISNKNKSGVKGVSWCKKRNRWRACCRVNTKLIHVGFFKEIEKAEIAVKEFRVKAHGEFARS